MKNIIYPFAAIVVVSSSVMAQTDGPQADISVTNTAVNLDPPPIFYSDTPAVLVSFMGEPVLKPVKSSDTSLMFAVNTNWDVLFDTESGAYFLLAGDHWLKSRDLVVGEWSSANALPQSFNQLPDDENWSEVKKRLTVSHKSDISTKVFISDRPAELIQTEGASHLSPISGTGLMYVSNSEDDLFFMPSKNNYYYLTAGRWFSATSLNGPWQAATLDLPGDFAKIPSEHVKGNVLVSVPGTPQAEDAVLFATTPQTATVKRRS